MKRKLMFFLLSVALLGFVFLQFTGSKVNASTTGDVDLLICNPGEDASTQMRFSFHTNVSGVVVQVAKKSDGNFDNAIILTPECISTDEAYPFKGTHWGMNWGTSYDPATMKVCEADVSGLEPDTEYMYRVGATNFSETRYFKTAGNDGVWAFAIMADPQNYTVPLHSAINPNMNRARANAKKELGMDLELVLCAGDQVEYGGIIDYWRELFDGVDLYKDMPLAMVVGNHDDLDGAGGKVTIGSYITDAVWNAPRNANNSLFTEDLYWFKWNNVLFCCMNSEAVGNERLAAQDEWFRNVCETVEHQYVVVMYHQGQWGGSCRPNYWYDTFEEYEIDLSFSGDNHDYNRGGVMDVGPSRGQDKFPGHYVVVDDTRNAKNAEVDMGGYCLVKVTPSRLYYYAYDQYDNLRDYAVFMAKRPFEVSETFDKEAFENSLKMEVNSDDFTKAILSWKGEEYYGHAKFVTILDENDREVKRYYLTSTSTKSIQIDKLTPYSEYNYKVKVEYDDGSSKIIPTPFKTQINYGTYSKIELKKLSSNHRITFTPEDIKVDLLVECYVYINGQKVATYIPGAKFVAIDSSLVTDGISIELKGLSKGDGLEYLLGKYPSEEEPNIELTLETKTLELVEGGSRKIVASASSGELEYSSSDASIATVDNSGNVTAIKEGTATITVKVKGTNVSDEVSVKVVKKTTVEFTVETKSLELTEGESGKIVASVSSGSSLHYHSSDTSIATVDENGNVVAIKEGEVVVRVEILGTNIFENVNVKVNKKAEATITLTVETKRLELTEGESGKIIASSNGEVEYSSSDNNIATVDSSGNVVAKKEGTITITVKVKGTGISEEVTIIVKAKEVEPTPKSGCNSGSIISIWSLFIPMGIIMFFRRRRFY